MKKGTTLRDYLVLRRRAVALNAQSWPQQRIAEALDVAQSTVSGWLADYRQRGEALFAYPEIEGRRSRMTAEQRKELQNMLEEGAEAHGFTRRVLDATSYPATCSADLLDRLSSQLHQ